MDEVQRLVMQVVNKDQIEVLNRLLDQESEAIRRLGVDLQAGIINQQQFEAATRAHGVTALGATKQIEALQVSTRNSAQAALTASHAFQDFAQGGIGGVLNNIPNLVTQLGGPAGLAATLSFVGVAAFVATPLVKSLWAALTDGGEAIPQGADALERLNTALKDSKERLDAMKASWGGSAGEVKAYNAQLGETARLEKAVSDEKERQSKLDAMRKAEQAGDAEAGSIATAATQEAGGVDKVVSALTPQLIAESASGNAAFARLRQAQETLAERLAEESDAINRAAIQEFYGKQIAAAEADVAKAQQQAESKAGGIVAAAGGGDRAAIAELARRLPGGAFGQATPEGMAAAQADEQAMMANTELSKDQRETRKRNAARRAEAERESADQAKAERQALLAEAAAMDKAAREDEAEQERIDAEQAKAERKAQEDEAEAMRKAATPEAKQEVADRRDRRRLQMIAVNETGVELDDTQAAEALKQTDEMIRAGVEPNIAARQSILGVVQGLVGVLQNSIQQSDFQAQEAAALRMQLEALQGMQRQTRTRMGRGR